MGVLQRAKCIEELGGLVDSLLGALAVEGVAADWRAQEFEAAGGGLRVHLAVAAAGGDHLALPQPRAQAKPHGCQLSHQQVEEARHGAPFARQGAVVEEEKSQVQGALVRGGGLAEGSLGGALQC